MDPLKYYALGDRLHGPPGFPDPCPQASADAGLIVSVFCLSVVLAASVSRRSRREARALDRLRGPANAWEAVCWTLGFLALGLVPFVTLGEGHNALSAVINTALAARSQTGYQQFDTVGAASEHAAYLVLVNALTVVPVVAAYALIALRRSPMTTAILVVSLALGLLLTASGGGRTRFAWAVLPVALFCGVRAVETHNGKYLKLTMVAVVFTATVWGAQLQYRLQGWADVGEDGLDLRSGLQNDLAAELAFIAENYPHREPFYGGDGAFERALRPIPDLLLLFATSPIPRRLWPGKPIDASWADLNYLRTGADGLESTTNITATVMGRAYVNYGWFGVVEIGLLMGFLCRAVDRWLERSRGKPFHTLLGCCAGYYLFISARDLTPGWLYPLLFLAAAGFIAGLPRRRARGPSEIAIAAFGPRRRAA
ncbi:MAG: oligosaccharide repeat unit polymerase [Thermoguttaceae bacterium]|jgi:oligosaccharide repeat unit polymerase|nr:oligosaccharide repeat unit polymerase [Thermoguttaceae bacterium]